MTSIIETSLVETDEKEINQGKTGLLAAGGVIGAIAASSCCVLPLTLTLLGVSGAWMSNLRALSPYQPYFIALTIVMIGLGFYRVYWEPRQACAVGAACARPLPNRLVKTGLWIGTVLVLNRSQGNSHISNTAFTIVSVATSGFDYWRNQR